MLVILGDSSYKTDFFLNLNSIQLHPNLKDILTCEPPTLRRYHPSLLFYKCSLAEEVYVVEGDR